ncbi:MAG: CBS domain-containing protein [Anaerolineales bacterium]|nr:CBS domain-containing protein [Anaerolineales bacterium]
MIPPNMHTFLLDRLPERTWETRLVREGGLRFLEFDSADVDQLARLGIEVDALGPRLVVCMWDEASPLEIGGYLVVDNLAMGKPSMGGIRMLPDVTPAAILNLARGMTLKNAAANLPYGGGKSGIVAGKLTPEQHTAVVRGFARLIYRYRDIYLPGPDVGTNDADMKTIAIENGNSHALSKPAELGGNRIDQLGAAAGGTVIALQSLLEEMPRLHPLPQFANLHIPAPDELTVLIQGFGAVGAHAARILNERLPGAKVIGISDALGYLYDENGLPIPELFAMWQEKGLVTRPYFLEKLAAGNPGTLKYSTQPNDLLRESAFCLIPAAPVANYLDTDPATHPSMTVDRMGRWAVIVEGANTYSPDSARKIARARMERAVYRQRGTLIATDYLVNSGGVIFAAQEKIIRTPNELRIPDAMLGNPDAVETWLTAHAAGYAALAEERLCAADRHREEAIRRNMRELVDVLLLDADNLPCEAAERISIRRIAAGESGRTAADLMAPIPTLTVSCTLQEAAARLVDAGSPILAVVNSEGALAGVLTEWDITRATAHAALDNLPAAEVMTRNVVTAAPESTILDMVRQLEYHSISAMPVVDHGTVRGMVSADLLARRSLLRLLQSQS